MNQPKFLNTSNQGRRRLLMHETGHSHGLAHHCTGDSIMNDGTSGCNGGRWLVVTGYLATDRQGIRNVSIGAITGEVNTVPDKERGLLTLSFNDGSGSERTITVRHQDPACRAIPALRRVIDHARGVDADTQAQICAAVRSAVERNVTHVCGVRVNNDAGRSYLARWW